VSPGTTVGTGATEEDADGSSKEAVDLSISGLTIMLDGLSVSCGEDVMLPNAVGDEMMR
jgi:hypothetical protein